LSWVNTKGSWIALRTLLAGFIGKNLRTQIVAITVGILAVPVVVVIYDLLYASKTEEMLLVKSEERLVTITNLLADGIVTAVRGQGTAGPPSAAALAAAFNQVAEPLAGTYHGVRLGFYLPETGQIFVQGFLHEYRRLSPEEQRERERRIFEEVKSGILAVAASKTPLARMGTTWDDQFLENLVPVFVDGHFAGVVWAEERLNPIFSRTRNFRLVTRYLTLLGFCVGAVGTLLVIYNLTGSVGRIKQGLRRLEQDLHYRLPPEPAEMGEIVRAINRLAEAVAEKEKLEEQLRRSERLAALGRLVGGLAHELRNPVGIIRATVQVLEQELPAGENARTALQIIKEQADRQNQLLHELLEFGRARQALVQPLNVNTLLRGVLDFTAPLLRQHGVRLECRLAQDLPPVEGDAERLKQVFVNLILNAVEAMPAGGRLTVTTRALPAEAARGNGVGGHVAVAFQDTGPGIPEQDLGRIFEPFYTTKDRGTGLGLAITHRFVELHGGRIEVESRPGEGATFTVVLPALTRGEAKGNGR